MKDDRDFVEKEKVCCLREAVCELKSFFQNLINKKRDLATKK